MLPAERRHVGEKLVKNDFAATNSTSGLCIVHPGLSRAAITEEGLHLLAGVETYLLETRAMKLRIIGSA